MKFLATADLTEQSDSRPSWQSHVKTNNKINLLPVAKASFLLFSFVEYPQPEAIVRPQVIRVNELS